MCIVENSSLSLKASLSGMFGFLNYFKGVSNTVITEVKKKEKNQPSNSKNTCSTLSEPYLTKMITTKHIKQNNASLSSGNQKNQTSHLLN